MMPNLTKINYNAYPVFLLSTRKQIGYVIPNDKGLWEAYGAAFDSFCGPFGTRYDAELEVVDMYERSCYY